MSYALIGKVKDAHGLKGEIYVLVFSQDTTWCKKLRSLRLTNSQGVQDYEVLFLREHKEGLIVKLKGIEDRNQSEALKNFGVEIPEDLLISKPGETIFLREILGFEVLLKDQSVGVIEGFSSNGAQDLLVIRNEDIRFEVPFVQDFILEIEFPSRKIKMNFPPELMDLSRC